MDIVIDHRFSSGLIGSEAARYFAGKKGTKLSASTMICVRYFFGPEASDCLESGKISRK